MGGGLEAPPIPKAGASSHPDCFPGTENRSKSQEGEDHRVDASFSYKGGGVSLPSLFGFFHADARPAGRFVPVLPHDPDFRVGRAAPSSIVTGQSNGPVTPSRPI